MSRVRTRELIAKDEGRKKKLYKDSRGFWTIGVGRLLDPLKGGRLSEDEIDYLFKNDLKEAWDGAESFVWFHGLNPARKAVVVSMIYQLGLKGFRQFRNTIKAINKTEYDEAARQMKMSIWHTQTPSRCRRLAKMMATGSWPAGKAVDPRSKPKPRKKTGIPATRQKHR